MPYSSTSDLPDYVKKYSAKRQRQWRAVFNSTHKRTGSEKRAFQAANSVAGGKKEEENDIENILAFSFKDGSKRL